VFGVRLCKNGEEQAVILDNYIPCGPDGSPCFSHANGNELWVILLEKAWAKVHGSYERIIGGQTHLTLRDLTGAPSYEFSVDEDDGFNRILEGEQKNYVMSAGINQRSSGETDGLRELGLVSEHSYGLIAAAEVTDGSGNKVQLVKLRNPWGNFEWRGKWSDYSDCWTEDLK